MTTQNTTARILSILCDGRTIVEHDGHTEWADCSRCGAHLDPTGPDAPAEWDGGCWHCGAPASEVGLEAEALDSDGNPVPACTCGPACADDPADVCERCAALMAHEAEALDAELLAAMAGEPETTCPTCAAYGVHTPTDRGECSECAEQARQAVAAGVIDGDGSTVDPAELDPVAILIGDEQGGLQDAGTVPEWTEAAARKAAEDWAEGGEWGDGPQSYLWITVTRANWRTDDRDGDGGNCYRFELLVGDEAEEPNCLDDVDCEGHDWQAPSALVGDCGGVSAVRGTQMRWVEVCAHCGQYRDTMGETTPGEYPHEPRRSSYRDADDRSRAWLASGPRSGEVDGIEAAVSEAAEGWTGCEWTTDEPLDMDGQTSEDWRQAAETCRRADRLGEIPEHFGTLPRARVLLSCLGQDELTAAGRDPQNLGEWAAAARAIWGQGGPARLLEESMQTAEQQADWLAEVERAAEGAAEDGRRAVEALREGRWSEAVERIESAERAEAEYGDSPTWGPVAEMVRALAR